MKDFSCLDLDKFQQEYEKVMLDKDSRLKYCPKKTSIHLNQENHMDVTYMNTMPAKTDNGSFVKSIYVDLRDSKNTIEDILYIRNGNVIRRTNMGLTPYRCGMIACLILRYFIHERFKPFKIGFIGTGNINKTIAKTIAKWIPHVTRFGIVNRTSSQETLDYFNELKPTDWNITDCDIVFSCTSNTSIDFWEENDLKNVKCLVALDGGNIFGPSTRTNRQFISDHVEQICDVYKDEFPMDYCKPLKIEQLSNSLSLYNKTFINLYGIAYADAILFEQLIEEDDF